MTRNKLLMIPSLSTGASTRSRCINCSSCKALQHLCIPQVFIKARSRGRRWGCCIKSLPLRDPVPCNRCCLHWEFFFFSRSSLCAEPPFKWLISICHTWRRCTTWRFLPPSLSEKISSFSYSTHNKGNISKPYFTNNTINHTLKKVKDGQQFHYSLKTTHPVPR